MWPDLTPWEPGLDPDSIQSCSGLGNTRPQHWPGFLEKWKLYLLTSFLVLSMHRKASILFLKSTYLFPRGKRREIDFYWKGLQGIFPFEFSSAKLNFWHLFYRKLDRGWRPLAMLTSRFSKYKKQWLIHQKSPRLQNLSWPPVTKSMPHLSFSGSGFAFYPKSFAFIKVRSAIT